MSGCLILAPSDAEARRAAAMMVELGGWSASDVVRVEVHGLDAVETRADALAAAGVVRPPRRRRTGGGA